MDSRSFSSIQQFADAATRGASDGRVSPPQVVRILEEAALNTETQISKITGIENEPQWEILRNDLLAQAALGRYYAERIRACTHLAYALKTGSQTDYDLSVKFFDSSRAQWLKLAAIADRVYAPLDNPLRAQRKFQWSRLTRELDSCNPALLWSRRKPNPQAPALVWNDSKNGETVERVEVRGVRSDGRIEFSCKPLAGDTLNDVLLWYKSFPSEYSWQSTSMRKGLDGLYTASLPDDTQGLLYQVEVQTMSKGAALFPNPLQERPYWIIEPSQP